MTKQQFRNAIRKEIDNLQLIINAPNTWEEFMTAVEDHVDELKLICQKAVDSEEVDK